MDAYEDRIQFLNSHEVYDQASYVLYWMQKSQRIEDNHALEFAISQANTLKKPLLVFFGLTYDYPEANERHYSFMLEGLSEISNSIQSKHAAFMVGRINPVEGVQALSSKACMVIVDRGYLKIERQWRKTVAEQVPCSMIQVETDIIVPVEVASDKQEYSAATLRRKISKMVGMYCQLPLSGRCVITPIIPDVDFETIHLNDQFQVAQVLDSMPIDHSVSRVKNFKGGSSQAHKLLQDFIEESLPLYGTSKGDPSKQMTSKLSPYLHFGQISPIRVYVNVKEFDETDTSGFLEELFVRRELAINFCFYNTDYASYKSLPRWAKNTLELHRLDSRPVLYSDEQLEKAKTSDPYWNAAQQQLVHCGFMHGYMRMYWGKKLLEWKENPQQGFELALYLNNRYGLDGRDPNGYTGVAWCFGLHDRPWAERTIFGNVRYMNDRGLERKFNMHEYLTLVERNCL